MNTVPGFNVPHIDKDLKKNNCGEVVYVIRWIVISITEFVVDRSCTHICRCNRLRP